MTKEQLKKDTIEYIKLVDEKYKNYNFKFIFEIATNYVIYPNYPQEHEEGYLTDGYHEEIEYDFIDDILLTLDYNNLMESTYGWENTNEPLFTRDELIEILNHSKFITATSDVPFMNEEEIAEEVEDRKESNSLLTPMQYTLESAIEYTQDKIQAIKDEMEAAKENNK